MPDGLKPGTQTSEYKFTLATFIIGLIMAIAGIVIELAPDLDKTFPGSHLLGIVLICAGATLKLGSKLGYDVSRGLAKSSGADSPPPQSGRALVPALVFLTIAALVVLTYLSPGTGTQRPPDARDVLSFGSLPLLAIGAIRCKFKLESKTQYASCNYDPATKKPLVNTRYKFMAVSGEENKEWSQWTPSGSFEFDCTNPAVRDKLDPRIGDEFFIDLVPVPKIEPAPAGPTL